MVMKIGLVAIAVSSLAVFQVPAADAFQISPPAPLTQGVNTLSLSRPPLVGVLGAVEDVDAEADTSSPKKVEEASLDAVEKLGRGSSKAKRGKRKGGVDTSSVKEKKAAASLTPEETFYEGPPAITETIAPTASILTVVGIIPAAAAWARQAWVRYRITSRRIRVTSGINGKDMAEIVYPDIVEIRTAKRLFGDGDLVAFLRDGAKFEMRNIPNFEEAVEFILKQVDPDVVEAYRSKGDVTKPAPPEGGIGSNPPPPPGGIGS